CGMGAELENGNVEVVDDPDLGGRGFMHVDFGALGSAIEQDAEYRHRRWHQHAFADPLQHAFVMLVFEKALEHMVGGDHNPVGMNAEAAADDFEGMSRG